MFVFLTKFLSSSVYRLMHSLAYSPFWRLRLVVRLVEWVWRLRLERLYNLSIIWHTTEVTPTIVERWGGEEGRYLVLKERAALGVVGGSVLVL